MAVPFARLFTVSVLCVSLPLMTLVSAFSPTDEYLVNCGSDKEATADFDRRNFVGDLSRMGSRFHHFSESFSFTSAALPPGPLTIYHTARVFNIPSRYVFPVKAQGTHMLRLHFRRFSSPVYDPKQARFHVLANGILLLNNFTIPNSETRILKEYLIWVGKENLEVLFMPSGKSTAFVNAIEVVSTPEDLVPDTAHVIISAGTVKTIDGLKRESLETIYRINVGGPKVTPFNDSLWRTWMPDDEFLLSSGTVSSRVYFGGRILYRNGGPTPEICPVNVYRTARVIGGTDSVSSRHNITWVFPVSSGYKYLIRMHFCDIASVALGLLQFNVYVNGDLLCEDLDLSSITGLLSSPFYYDLIVNGESLRILSLTVGPSERSLYHAVDGILNGVEIMKMNNSVGSFDGFVNRDLLLKSSSGNCIFSMIFLGSAFFSLLAGSLILHRRLRILMMRAVGWSRLPDVSQGDAKNECSESCQAMEAAF